jgi:hypothetical protein
MMKGFIKKLAVILAAAVVFSAIPITTSDQQ